MKNFRGLIRGIIMTSLILVFSVSAVLFGQENNKIAMLTKRSDLIIVGKVNKIHSEWNENKTRIYSRITLKVDQLVKGSSPGEEVSFLQPGGEIGTVGEVYSDIPRFKDKENVLVFLEKAGYGLKYRVTGGMEGKFPITDNVQTSRKTIDGMNLNNIIKKIKNVELKH